MLRGDDHRTRTHRRDRREPNIARGQHVHPSLKKPPRFEGKPSTAASLNGSTPPATSINQNASLGCSLRRRARPTPTLCRRSRIAAGSSSRTREHSCWTRSRDATPGPADLVRRPRIRSFARTGSGDSTRSRPTATYGTSVEMRSWVQSREQENRWPSDKPRSTRFLPRWTLHRPPIR